MQRNGVRGFWVSAADLRRGHDGAKGWAAGRDQERGLVAAGHVVEVGGKDRPAVMPSGLS